MNPDTSQFLDQLNALLGEGDYSKMDALLTLENIDAHAHWFLYYCLFLVELNERKNFKNALAASDDGLKLNPDHPRLQWFRVLAYLKLEDWQNASFFGEAYCAENNDDYDAHFGVAHALRQSGAITRADEIEAIGHAYYGFRALRAGNIELAYEAFSNAVEHNSDYLLARIQKNRQARRLGKLEEAKSDLLHCLQFSEVYIDVLVELCLIAEQEQCPEELAMYSNKILDVDADHEFALNAKIMLARMQGGYEGIFDASSEVIEAQPNNLFANFVRFSCAYDMSNNVHYLNSVDGGVKTWEQLNRWLETNLVEAAVNRAKRLLGEDDNLPLDEIVRFFKALNDNWYFAEVVELFEGACDSIKASIEAQCIYGHALGQSTTFQRAIDYFREKSQVFPDNFVYKFHWIYWESYLYAECPDRDLEFRLADGFCGVLLKGIEQGMGDGQTYFYLGALFCRLYAYKAAEEWLEKADQLDVRTAYLNYWLADLRRAQGDFPEALDLYIDGFYKRLKKDSEGRELEDLKMNILWGLVDSCKDDEEACESAFRSLEYFKEDLDLSEKARIAVRLRDVGIEATLKKSFEWFMALSEEGLAVATFCVGRAYEDALGVEQDYRKAAEYYEACGDDYPEAYLARAVLVEESKGFDYNEEAIIKWLTLGAECGDVSAVKALAYRYKDFESVQDYEQAAKWAEVGAKEDNPECQRLLAYLYQNGLGVETDNDIAMMWYHKALEGEAERGD